MNLPTAKTCRREGAAELMANIAASQKRPRCRTPTKTQIPLSDPHAAA